MNMASDLLCGGAAISFLTMPIIFSDQVFYWGVKDDHTTNCSPLRHIISHFPVTLNEATLNTIFREVESNTPVLCHLVLLQNFDILHEGSNFPLRPSMGRSL